MLINFVVNDPYILHRKNDRLSLLSVPIDCTEPSLIVSPLALLSLACQHPTTSAQCMAYVRKEGESASQRKSAEREECRAAREKESVAQRETECSTERDAEQECS